ncbi:MAG: aldehyde dehydrogenase family protein [Nocardioidaceae bacterium]
MEQTRIRIGGVPTAADTWDDIVAPLTSRLVARVPQCDSGHVSLACEVAEQAWLAGPLPAEQRSGVLSRAADLLSQRRHEFAQTITLESAKPVRHALAEVDVSVAALQHQAKTREREPEVAPGARFDLTVPLGPVAILTTSAGPLMVTATRVAEAIAVGCPAIVKPSRKTPVSSIRLLDLLVESGLPPTWVSVVTGIGKDVGNELAGQQRVRMVAVSGDPIVVADVTRQALGKRVAADTGSVTVILEAGVHLDQMAVELATWLGSAPTTGWGRVHRILVARATHGACLDMLTRAAEALVVGDPADPAVDTTGHADVDRLHQLVGPYDDLEDAWALANRSPRAETVAILTPDLTRAMSAIRRLDYPRVVVNTIPTRPLTCAELGSPMTGSRHVSIAS